MPVAAEPRIRHAITEGNDQIIKERVQQAATRAFPTEAACARVHFRELESSTLRGQIQDSIFGQL
jgi:hypothetical protein